MNRWQQALRHPMGAPGSLLRKLTINILLALFVAVLLAMAVLIYEFFEHLEENLDDALVREAHELLYQVQPDQPSFGMDTRALRFRGAGGAYRYTVFGPDAEPMAGGEDSPEIRAQIADLTVGGAAPVALPGERRGMALCGVTSGTRVCALASTYAPLTDSTIHQYVLHEIEEQLQWILIGSFIVVASARLAARISLQPLDRLRQEAREVGPDVPERRLSVTGLPTEILPLVEAVNRAFDRLETGYRAQREFSANVAHEVRTPLAVLHSSVDTIEDPTLQRRLKRDLKQLESIFEQLVDLARAEAMLPSTLALVDLKDLALRLSFEHAPEAIKAGKKLAVSGDDIAPVYGNAGLISIAIDNLVRNALAYSPAGTEVEIRIQSTPPAIWVLDQGPGIPPAERDALFERFARGRNALGSEGSGLGLAIVKSVADAHGAKVRIEGRSEGGSAFGLEFPGENAADANNR